VSGSVALCVHLVGSSILLYLIYDARSNKNQIKTRAEVLAMWYDVGLVVLSHQNDEVGSINMFGCFLFMCLYLQMSHFTIRCFICEDLVNI